MKLSETMIGVVDVETTHLDAEVGRVVECAVVEVVPGESVEHANGWESLFDPGIPIPPESSAVHHITDVDVKGKPVFETVVPFMFLGEASAAHFAEFDASFIPQIADKPIICTYRLARHLWPTLDQYGNQYLRYLHGLEIPEAIRSRPAHRAYPDAFVTACLLKLQLQVVSELKPEIETVEQLVEWISGPILLYRIGFGKYGPRGAENPGPKGRLWSDVPTEYLRWLSNQWDKELSKGGSIEADPDTVFTVYHYLEAGDKRKAAAAAPAPISSKPSLF